MVVRPEPGSLAETGEGLRPLALEGQDVAELEMSRGIGRIGLDDLAVERLCAGVVARLEVFGGGFQGGVARRKRSEALTTV